MENQERYSRLNNVGDPCIPQVPSKNRIPDAGINDSVTDVLNLEVLIELEKTLRPILERIQAPASEPP
jgi:hypothetical protein